MSRLNSSSAGLKYHTVPVLHVGVCRALRLCPFPALRDALHFQVEESDWSVGGYLQMRFMTSDKDFTFLRHSNPSPSLGSASARHCAAVPRICRCPLWMCSAYLQKCPPSLTHYLRMNVETEFIICGPQISHCSSASRWCVPCSSAVPIPSAPRCAAFPSGRKRLECRRISANAFHDIGQGFHLSPALQSFSFTWQCVGTTLRRSAAHLPVSSLDVLRVPAEMSSEP